MNKDNEKEELDNSFVEKKSKSGIILAVLLLIISLTCLGVSVYFLLNSGSDKKEESNKTKNSVDKQDVEYSYTIEGNVLNDFDLYFLKVENKKENKIYSPLSIKYALEMLAEGADGDSKTQLNNVIGTYSARKYTNSKNMSFANALFVKESYKDNVSEDYITKLSTKYNADIKFDSFNNADNVNKWVSDKTLGLIKKLFDNISNLDYILINALAIDMEWVNTIQPNYEQYHVTFKHEDFGGIYIAPYKIEGYYKLDFENNTTGVSALEIGAVANRYDAVKDIGRDNIYNTVSTEYKEWSLGNACGMGPMNLSDEEIKEYTDSFIDELDEHYNYFSTSTDFGFYVDDDVKVFAKDLKEYNGTTLRYIGIMPTSTSLDSYIEKIDSDTLNDILYRVKESKLTNYEDGYVTRVTGYIPVFKFDYELDLMSDLEKIGISDVFNQTKANLPGLGENSFIASASHKATIEFSNEGITAAAATEEGGMGDAYCGYEHLFEIPIKEIDLTFDKPYLFIIMDKDTSEVWFTGTVYNPSEYVNPWDE